ncbi:hypothetical protein [Streptomyces odontomachi]|uniref:hypothetical protein n=1 Tax=Streptomyces odontomachi TaxID=2944940 RepID=UPI00210A7B65|nr:hypothetical protein [Streptomyces sp. ODS25]
MRKIQKAALVVAMLGTIGLAGAGSAAAYGGGSSDLDITQSNACKSHDLNIAALNNIGVLNGLAGNALGGEGNPGAQVFEQGSDVACSNAAG